MPTTSAALLVPGSGGRTTTPAAISTAVMTWPDGTTWMLDCQRCSSFQVQMTSTATVGGTFQLEQTFDGTNFAPLGSAVAVVNGSTVFYNSESLGPFGLVRVNPASVTNLDATHSITLLFHGYAKGSGLF